MSKNVYTTAVNSILASITTDPGSGRRASFEFKKPGSSIYDRRTSIVDIFYNSNGLLRASLFIRRHGHAYLKYLSVEDVSSLVQRFVKDNYWYIAEDTFPGSFSGSYSGQVSEKSKHRLAEALASSELFVPSNELTLFPLVPIQVKADFEGEIFFLIRSTSLQGMKLPASFNAAVIKSGFFPPLVDWKGRIEAPASWLGVRSPNSKVSSKLKAAILGALALAPQPRYRHLFSGRNTFGGRCTISASSATVAFGDSHCPQLMHDIVIRSEDHNWLNKLADKLVSERKEIRREIKALEYFYRAWPYGPSERFPVLCMTLDAIFGSICHSTAAVIDGVLDALGLSIDRARLRDLMELRASVIHGGAPDVYDSSKYRRYYMLYEADPIHDLELVVSECLRRQVFGADFVEQADPNAEIIKKAQDAGHLPRSLQRSTILNPTDHA
jgi:hypothetical protein